MLARVRLLKSALALSLVLCSLLGTSTAAAVNQEPLGINLGGTSFLDGFGRNEGGFTYLGYFQYVMGQEIHGSLMANGDGSKPLPIFNDPQIDVFLLINQLIYTVPDSLFWGTAHLAFDFLLPVIAFDSSFEPGPPFPGVQLTDNGLGIGDLTIGPMLQFQPIMVDGRPVFSNRLEVDIIAPIGKYDPSIDLNQSSNFVSLVAHWAATVLPFPHFEVSARVHYLYNFKNVRPALGRLYSNEVPPPVKSAQAGQAGWVNFATSYELFKDFRIGANGYYFQQFNLDLWEMLDGTSNPGISYADTGKLRIFSIGPGLMWSPADHDKLYANFYMQLLVENGPQSNVLNLRWVHGFP